MSQTEVREDNIIPIEREEPVHKVIKVKEVSCGMEILNNIGNYENVRTKIELTAEVNESQSAEECMEGLSEMVKVWSRKQYKEIKEKMTTK